MSQAKERPILFSGPMVRAILEDRKTVTRRAVKIQPSTKGDIGSYGLGQPFIRHPDPTKRNPECPYGRPGDRLWVRESHAQVFEVDIPEERPVGPIGTSGSPGRPDWKSRYVYRADGEMPNVQWHHVGDSQPVRWTPSIHMPRTACRILLEITAVRVERLQEVTEEQARAEGMLSWTFEECDGDPRLDGQPCTTTNWHWEPQENECDGYGCAEYAFAGLWKAINGETAWDANPWVWVVEFKRVEP